MNIERLDLLVTMLKEVKAKTWVVTSELVGVQQGYKNDVDFDLASWASTGSCGTTACVVGHAALDKRFNDLGLTPNFANHSAMDIMFECSQSWEACNNFFEFKDNETLYHPVPVILFAAESYNETYSTTTLIEQIIRRIELLKLRGEDEFLDIFQFGKYRSYQLSVGPTLRVRRKA